MLQNISRPHRPQQFVQRATRFQQHECSLLNNIHQLSRNIAILPRMTEVPALRKPLASHTAHPDSLPHLAGAYPEFMPVPPRDSELIQIMDAELARVTGISGPWLACRPGCAQCCHGAFAVNALDAARLRSGMESLRQSNPTLAARIEARTQVWLIEHSPSFPGNIATGILGKSKSEQEAFEDFANEAPCPALDPATGLCDVYEYRPMTCRIFGPPVRVESEDPANTALACCELCFIGAAEETIAACELHPPHAFESEILTELDSNIETIVAFALIPAR
jgi:Fe-S-cluster containining protein